jgi:hypothetical protein
MRGACENIACHSIDVGKQVQVIWAAINVLGLEMLADKSFQMQW